MLQEGARWDIPCWQQWFSYSPSKYKALNSLASPPVVTLLFEFVSWKELESLIVRDAHYNFLQEETFFQILLFKIQVFIFPPKETIV